MDNGLIDDPGKICDSHMDKDYRIKVIHKQNAGVNAARNSGIDIIAREYPWFVDGDDHVMSDYVECLLHLCVCNTIRRLIRYLSDKK